MIASTLLADRPFQIPLQLISITLLLVSVYFYGGVNERSQWEQHVAEAQQHIKQLEEQSKSETIKIVTAYRDKIKYINKVEQQVVTEFVTLESDKQCNINNGFIRFHNALVDSIIIEPTESDKDMSDVKLQQLLDVIKTNYTHANLTRQQLIQLQDWVTKQKQLQDDTK